MAATLTPPTVTDIVDPTEPEVETEVATELELSAIERAMRIVDAKADKLVTASERASYDPFTDVDWSPAFDDAMFYLPPEFLPLYGTAAWDAMSEAERIAYSRHEVAALCSAGIWFENILMQILLKELYNKPATDGSFRYLLVETADECRHSSMFGEMISRAGTPAYQVPRYLRYLGRFLVATARGPISYVSILAAEELLDISNRATMKDDRVHPVSRQVAKLHVFEEARHMSYARTYIAEVFPTLGRFRRLAAAVMAPFVVAGITDAMCNPAVYAELGIEGGVKTARKNPAYVERRKDDLERLTGLLSEVGVITRWTRPVWRAFGLVR